MSDHIFKLEDYAPAPYLVPEVTLSFDLHPEHTTVVAELTVQRRVDVTPATPLDLDGDELSLQALHIDGQLVQAELYEVGARRLRIKQIPEAAVFRLRIETKLNPAANRRLMGLYLSNRVFCTQCEAEGFRRITYFVDRPDNLSVYTVRIEGDRETAPVLLSNGNPGEAGDLGNGRHFAIWHDPHPKPSYLFALVAGDLAEVRDRFVTGSGREVRLGIYVEHSKEARAAYAMDALKRAMRWDEQAFGREYDLDVFNIVAVSDFNIGAMENKGLNIFNDRFILASPETATDADFAHVETLVAHEYFHNWTGNRITCRDWFQLCLKEGLTVYRDHEFSADQRDRTVRRVQEVRLLKSQQFPEDQGPLAHPVRPRRYREINNFYTATVYEKGAEIVRMLAILLGQEAFRAGMQLYFERHDGQAVTIEDFLQAFSDVSSENLSQFSLWYHQAGTPRITVATEFDVQRQTFAVELEQSLAPTPGAHRNKAMHIPLAFSLIGENGAEMRYSSVEGGLINDGVIHLKQRRQRFLFSGISSPPVLSINRGFSAPVTLEHKLGGNGQLLLAGLDTDLFSRWQALNSVLTEALIQSTQAVRWEKSNPDLTSICGLLEELSSDERLAPAFRALMLTLPSEADIARDIGSNIDPDAILAAREQTLLRLGETCGGIFGRVFNSLEAEGPFQPDGASAGRRALRNVLLEYLSAAEGSPKRALGQFRASTNMTDRMAALTILVHRFAGTSACQEALAAFEQRHHRDPLVMDKWLNVQATAPGAGAVEAVLQLKSHPHFAPDNPNRMRALIFAFANNNQSGFHRADGAGYRLLADTILATDKFNPVLASRLATAFGSWRSLELVRFDKMRRMLVEISKAPGLSTNLADIIRRTLA